MLVQDAGIDSSRMTFAEPPALFWESIIVQCEKQESLRTLVPVLLARYPNNKLLQEAVEPWIHLPKHAQESEVVPKAGEQIIVVAETPTTVTTMSQVKKTPGTEVEVEHVPVLVPREFAEDAAVALIATVNSLRVTVDQLYRDVRELIAWREALSQMSRAEVAVKEGGNEPGPNKKEPERKENP